MGVKNIFLILGLAILVVSCTHQAQKQAPAQNNQNLVRNAEILKNRDMSGVETMEADYGPATGFLALPKKDGKYPAVVMIHEWWGLNDNIKEMAKSLAAEGYVVLAADLFDGKVAKNSSEAQQLTGAIRRNSTGAIANMKSAVAYLKNLDNVNVDKVASMGWCFGGQMSLQLALNEPLAATVIYYGNLETNATRLSVIKWPVLGIFGDKDTSIPVESVRKFESALNENKVENDIRIYPGVGHAFANPSGMNYAPNETKDAWKKTVEFLDKYLK